MSRTACSARPLVARSPKMAVLSQLAERGSDRAAVLVQADDAGVYVGGPGHRGGVAQVGGDVLADDDQPYLAALGPRLPGRGDQGVQPGRIAEPGPGHVDYDQSAPGLSHLEQGRTQPGRCSTATRMNRNELPQMTDVAANSTAAFLVTVPGRRTGGRRTPASRRGRRPAAGCPATGAGARRTPRCTGPPGRTPRGCVRTSGPPRWCPRRPGRPAPSRTRTAGTRPRSYATAGRRGGTG